MRVGARFPFATTGKSTHNSAVQRWKQTAEQLLAAADSFVRRHWQRLLRIRERIHLSEEALHLLLAGGVGVIGGVVNLLFFYFGEQTRWFILHQHGRVDELTPELAWWQRLIIPCLGGLAAGLVLQWGQRIVRTQGPGNMLEAVAAGDGRLPFRTSLLRALSSTFSINTGAAIGQEGPMTHLTATIASKCGQLAHWQPYRLRLLVACGAASGIAAAYNAPIAGSVFAAHIVLGNFAMNLFAPLVFAAVVATMLSRSFFGIEPWYEAPEFNFTNMLQLPWFVLLGLIAGGAGAYFLKTLRQFETWFARIPASYLPARLALGGLLLGMLAVPVPEAWGNGRQPTNLILHEPLVWHVLLTLLLAKWLAIGTTVGSGAMGGLITPTLFIGAGVGGLLGSLLHEAHWALSLPTGAFALVGMASVFAATTHSPLLAMILAFELSLNYSFMPPLMIGCVVATLVSRHLHPGSVYNESLRRKGLSTPDDRLATGAADQQTVGDLMLEPVTPVRENTPLREIANRFLTSTYNFIPVVDAQKRLLGMVALHDLKEHLNAGEEFSFVIAYDIMRPMPQPLVPNLILTEALPLLLKAEMEHVPVVDGYSERRLIGRIARTEALGLLSETIATAGQGAD